MGGGGGGGLLEEQEWYEESPEPEPLSPATQKRIDDEFKRDVDECTTDRDWMLGPVPRP